MENFDDKSKYLLDSLYSFTNVYSVNDNSYYLIKGLFMNSLKSYMKIIYNYILNSVVSPLKENESEKVNSKNYTFIFFKKKSENFFSFENFNFFNKIFFPNFMENYEIIVIKNFILINFLKQNSRFDFQLANLNLLDLINFIDFFDFDGDFKNENLDDFVKFKFDFFKNKERLFEFQDKHEEVSYYNFFYLFFFCLIFNKIILYNII